MKGALIRVLAAALRPVLAEVIRETVREELRSIHPACATTGDALRQPVDFELPEWDGEPRLSELCRRAESSPARWRRRARAWLSAL